MVDECVRGVYATFSSDIENLFDLQKKTRVLVTAGRGSLRPHRALQPGVLQVRKMPVLIILSVSQPSRRVAAALAVQENDECSTKCRYSAHDDRQFYQLIDRYVATEPVASSVHYMLSTKTRADV